MEEIIKQLKNDLFSRNTKTVDERIIAAMEKALEATTPERAGTPKDFDQSSPSFKEDEMI